MYLYRQSLLWVGVIVLGACFAIYGAVRFFQDVWPSASVKQSETVVYMPAYSFGLEQPRPINVELKETVGDSLTAMQGVLIFSRYSGQKIPDARIYAAKNGQPQMLYVRPEGSEVWHGYPVPTIQFCVDPNRPALARR